MKIFWSIILAFICLLWGSKLSVLWEYADELMLSFLIGFLHSAIFDLREKLDNDSK